MTASGTYSPDKISLKYFWKFGENIEKTGRNPTTVEFTTGKYTIFLMVQDANGVTSYREIMLNVPEKSIEIEDAEEKDNIRKNTKKSIENTNSEVEKVDFSQVELILQNPKNFHTEDEINYICETKTGNCSANFSLENTTKNMRFYWGWDNEVAFTSKNPRAKTLTE